MNTKFVLRKKKAKFFTRCKSFGNKRKGTDWKNEKELFKLKECTEAQVGEKSQIPKH